jgi:RecA/RadA recombinase
MNANELANLLEVDSWYKLVTREEIATMLRQQQAEIEALKKELETCKTIVALSNIAWKNKFGDDQ